MEPETQLRVLIWLGFPKGIRLDYDDNIKKGSLCYAVTPDGVILMDSTDQRPTSRRHGRQVIFFFVVCFLFNPAISVIFRLMSD